MKVLIVLSAILGFGYAQQLPADQRNPCDSKFLTVADNTYCDRYWVCDGGEPVIRDCPNGLAFVGARRGLAEGCDYFFRGNYCVHKQRANPPISTEHCDWLYGVFGHETSCTRYWTCWNGTATEQFCIGGLLYNEETHSCDWPYNVEGCQKHPLCKEDPNANVPLGKSCERYWSCQGGYPRLQRCPATLVFDKITRRCVNPPTEDCEAPTTTPHPDYEDSQFFRAGGGPPRGVNPNARRRQQSRVQETRPREQLIEEPISQPRATLQQQERPSRLRPEGPRPVLLNNARQSEPTPIIFEAPQQQFAASEGSEVREPPIEGAIPLPLN